VQQSPTPVGIGPQIPLAQEPLQHCALVVQARPSALQTGGVAQRPLRQDLPLQHCALAVQAPPRAVQVEQTPLTQVPPLQQSAVVLQLPPAALQPPQVPLMQLLPLQHCEVELQASPAGKQVAHTPATQNFCPVPQHSEGFSQAEPTPAQQVWPLQVLPLQHAALPPPQESPTPEQCWQMPLLQMFEQQSLASVQTSLSPEQLPHLSL